MSQEIKKQGTPEISPALKSKMLAAGSYEELLKCWKQLAEEFDLKPLPKWGTTEDKDRNLRYWLTFAHQCFSQPNCACDTAIKQIWENKLSELTGTGIPKEFLLQTVRVGALQDQLNGISSKERHKAMMNTVDVNGYTWANQELLKLENEKKEQVKVQKEFEAKQLEVKKEQTIGEIGRDMKDPNFNLTDEQKKLLRRDFQGACALWKAFYGGANWTRAREKNKNFDDFLNASLDQKLSSEIALEFKRLCEEDEDISEDLKGYESFDNRLKFEMLNPESGWFYVAKMNNSTTLRQFLNNCASNMDSWMQL